MEKAKKAKKFIGFYVREEIRDAIHEMAEVDLRTLGATLEILIAAEMKRREQARREQTGGLPLVDTMATYDVGGPA